MGQCDLPYPTKKIAHLCSDAVVHGPGLAGREQRPASPVSTAPALLSSAVATSRLASSSCCCSSTCSSLLTSLPCSSTLVGREEREERPRASRVSSRTRERRERSRARREEVVEEERRGASLPERPLGTYFTSVCTKPIRVGKPSCAKSIVILRLV